MKKLVDAVKSYFGMRETKVAVRRLQSIVSER